ncbi:MAG TPA: L-seryl-tRNA(Sec) selenium transferase, partial [Pyrinomonadaceae bacterium]|nr:L-seryl-tRNA(Sec) selenium transferase [Pyrinomonadaceae bacterium]
MNESSSVAVSSLFRELPSVDEVLKTPALIRIRTESGERRAAALARDAVSRVRDELAELNESGRSRASLLERVAGVAENAWRVESGKRIRRVINATGVVIHTNLGRAPLSAAAVKALVDEASGYCTVEYDIETGKRGRRGERAEGLLCELTGAESSLVVNNCAAAAMLVLRVLAKGGEVIISRGELVEIGGDFRIPDVLEESGATLREVGTTNRTNLSDYQNAIGERTSMLLRVHTSNFRIIGFTDSPSLSELAELARENKLILYEDAGSGALVDLTEYGLADEPFISRSIEAGADIVTFSGDKLLGGPQAGIIVGSRELIERLRQSPMYRALRVSKIVCAALEATLEAYQRSTAVDEVPVLKMLAVTPESLALRTKNIADLMVEKLAPESGLFLDLIDGNSVVGGGAAPGFQPATTLLAIRHAAISSNELELRLRSRSTPIVTRLRDDRVLIDLRTVSV